MKNSETMHLHGMREIKYMENPQLLLFQNL